MVETSPLFFPPNIFLPKVFAPKLFVLNVTDVADNDKVTKNYKIMML